MTTTSPLAIFINGRTHQVSPQHSLGEIVQGLGLDARQILVELNGQALLRDEWPARFVEHGDRIELIKVVAGG